MRRLSVVCAAAGLGLSALAAASPAQADPYHLIRWSDTGFCQIWNEGIPTTPWSYNFIIVGVPVPTFLDALNLKGSLIRTGTCAF
jgi:hypothetical protein